MVAILFIILSKHTILNEGILNNVQTLVKPITSNSNLVIVCATKLADVHDEKLRRLVLTSSISKPVRNTHK